MEVTKLEYLEKKKVKVYIDYEYHFLLYVNDINKHGIKENQILSDEIYKDIVENTVYRRAKQKALAILKYMDRSEYELRSKLKQADYTEDIIERTIDYVRSYHYIDDHRFVSNYIKSKHKNKSKKTNYNDAHTKRNFKRFNRRNL